jgi:AbrB family looped-hinge helix DNA binding protein
MINTTQKGFCPESALTTVTLTRKGQTTIPKNLREKYDMSRGAKLEVIDTGDGVMFRKAQSTIDLIGSSKRTFDEMRRRLDEIRREDA